MTHQDIAQVVDIHIEAFPGFFLTLLGRRVLSHYYKTVLMFPQNVAQVVENRNELILGFVVGFTDPQGFYILFKKQRKKLIISILLALLRRPYLLKKISNNANRIKNQTADFPAVTELSSIAVSPRSGKRGIGSRLLQSFVETARISSINPISLTTDAENNASTRQFYERAGFTLGGFEQRAGRKLCVYYLSIDSSS